MDPREVKEENERALATRGIPVNRDLPALPGPEAWVLPRPHALGERCLVLSAAICRAYGAPSSLVRDWLEKEQLLGAVSVNETALFRSSFVPEREALYFQLQVDCLLELGWAGRVIGSTDPFGACPESLAELVPKPGQPTGLFRRRIRLRGEEALLAEADLLFRLHGALRQARSRGVSFPLEVPGHVTEQRLRAIRWVLDSRQDWDTVDLSRV